MRKFICEGYYKRQRYQIEVEDANLLIYWDRRKTPDYTRRHLTIAEMRTLCDSSECNAAAKEVNYQYDRCWEDL